LEKIIEKRRGGVNLPVVSGQGERKWTAFVGKKRRVTEANRGTINVPVGNGWKKTKQKALFIDERKEGVDGRVQHRFEDKDLTRKREKGGKKRRARHVPLVNGLEKSRGRKNETGSIKKENWGS